MRENESSVYKIKGFILNNKLKLYCLIFYIVFLHFIKIQSVFFFLQKSSSWKAKDLIPDPWNGFSGFSLITCRI